MGSNCSKDDARQRKRLSGIRDLRTAAKAHMRSKPKVEGQEHLDMYVLTRDRARWSRMARQSAEAMEEIDKDIEKVRKTQPAVEDTQNQDNAPNRPRKRPGKTFGTFRVHY